MPVDSIQSAGGPTAGFDYLRIVLAVGVLTVHALSSRLGSVGEAPLWTSPFRFAPAMLLPMFFALSGFLVAGSLERTRLHQFALLRVLRIFPALAVEIFLSAVVLGLLFTSLPKSEYLAHPSFWIYSTNAVGWIHYTLPGVFVVDGVPAVINGQLWTIPYELECYVALAVLALLGIARKLGLFGLAVASLVVILSVLVFTVWPIENTQVTPGRALVLSFLVGVFMYLARCRIVYSHGWGIVSAIATLALLSAPETVYLATVPIGYLTVWLGLMRPPKIPFGDLSYGVYLFHYPIQQMYVHVIDKSADWWSTFSLPVTGAFAWLSWTLIEKPLLDRKRTIIENLEALWRRIFARRRAAGSRGPDPRHARAVGAAWRLPWT